MSDHFWLTQAQIERLKPYFPRSHGVPRVDDRRVLSGIIHVLKRGLQWRDAPAEYGPHKRRVKQQAARGGRRLRAPNAPAPDGGPGLPTTRGGELCSPAYRRPNFSSPLLVVCRQTPARRWTRGMTPTGSAMT